MNALLLVAALVPGFDNPSLELKFRVIEVEAEAAALRAEPGDNAARVKLVNTRLEWLREAAGRASELREKDRDALKRRLMRRVRSLEFDLASLEAGDAAKRPGLEAKLSVYRRWATELGVAEEHLTVSDLALTRALLVGQLRYSVAARGADDPKTVALRARVEAAEKALDARRPLDGVARLKAYSALIGAARSLKKDKDEAETPAEADEYDVVVDTLLILALDP